MKITIIADVLGRENNGTTITIKRLIEGLKKRGHSVRVVSPMETDEEGYFTVPKRNFGIFDDYIRKNGVELAAPDVRVLEEAMDGSDVVHIVLPFKTGRKAQEIAMQKGIPYTTAFHCQPENITSHAYLKNCKFANNCIYSRFLHKFYNKAQFVHCPSAFIADTLRDRGYNMDLRVISNGVTSVFTEQQSEKPQALKDKFCILFTGRFSKEKRHDLLIHAVQKSKYRDRIQLLFAGDGPRRAKIVKMGAHLPHPPILGFYSKEELVKLINYCDLYVHPSDIEIEAIACLEAISCGVVPVISDSPRSATNAFALTPDNLFKAGNVADLSAKIDYLIEHPERKLELHDMYQNYTEQFKMDYCLDRMEEMFIDAIAYYTAREQTASTERS